MQNPSEEPIEPNSSGLNDWPNRHDSLADLGGSAGLPMYAPHPSRRGDRVGFVNGDELNRHTLVEMVPILTRLRERGEPPPPSWRPVVANWEYAKGDPAEGLQAEVHQFPSPTEPVIVPHLVDHPDTPLWYRSQIFLETSSAVKILADDGAHLFINGTRITGDRHVFIVDIESPGQHEIVVRVLNKAVDGGLVSVETCPLEEYRLAISRIAHHERITRAVYKVGRMRPVPSGILTAARNLVRVPNEANLGALERLLARYPMITVGPIVHSLGPQKSVIAWEMDGPSEPQVIAHMEDGTATRACLESSGTFHMAILEGYRAGSSISYQIKLPCVLSETYVFRSLPIRPKFSFTVWGDSHIGATEFRRTISSMLFEDVAFTVGIGDLVVDAANKRRWEEFFEIGSPLFSTTPAFFCGGNHDYDDCFEDLNSVYFNRYARLDAKPFYAWTVAHCRFVALDPNIQFPTGIDEDSEQYQWLIGELESEDWRAAKWHFVFIHQPPFGCGWAPYCGDQAIRTMLEKLIPKYKIDFVVSGHIHGYERLTRTYGEHTCTFLVVGGAGGGLDTGPVNPETKMDVVESRHHFGLFEVDQDTVEFRSIATVLPSIDHFRRSKLRGHG